MARERSIINSSPLAFAIFVFYVAISDAELTESQKLREWEESKEASITSGIRNLEHIRRQIIDSRKSRVLPSIEEPETSGYSRYSGGATMEENNLSSRTTGTRNPRRQVDLSMYEALSKIAKVQVADPNMDHSSVGGSYGDEINGRGASQSTFSNPTGDEMKKQFFKNIDERNLKNDESTARTSIITSGEISFGPRKFYCRPIQDIYIPKVDKRMPAYLCTLGKRAFVISSERFHEDNRNHFEVSVDETTFLRLNPMNSGTATLTSGVSVLPATLVLKTGENGYTVRQIDEVQGTSDP